MSHLFGVRPSGVGPKILSKYSWLDKTIKLQVRIVVATGGTMGLAVGIIEDTQMSCVLFYFTHYSVTFSLVLLITPARI